MSTEREMKQFEAALRKLPLPPSKVNRDELFYQAGWAAAESAQARAAKPSKRLALWQGATAVLAASLLLVLLHPFTAEPVVEVVESSTPVEPPITETVVKEDASRTQPVIQPTVRRFHPRNAPMLAMRDRALRMEFDEMSFGASLETIQITEPKTSRELMEEFIHKESQANIQPAPAENLWNWTRLRQGEPT